MKQYIKYVADRLITQLGYVKIYNVANPFEFMSRIELRNKSNFFEDVASEYTRNTAAIGNDAYSAFEQS